MKRSFSPVEIYVVLSEPVMGMFGERKVEIWMATETGKPVRVRLMWSLEKLDSFDFCGGDLEETDPVKLAQKVAEAKLGRTFDGRVVDWLDAVFFGLERIFSYDWSRSTVERAPNKPCTNTEVRKIKDQVIRYNGHQKTYLL
ncbi:hypothetical protein BJ742DRAFT_741980 [Cladochytrium replicatum]|nr:hypothetical protein BJ742DRAFT_741980 [Cladochytrium replicatum]